MSRLRLRSTHEIAGFSVSVRLLFVALILALLAAITACSSLQPVAPSTSSSSTQQSSARIVLSPANASMTSGGKLQLTALIQNSDSTGVRWSATAGTISPAGLFNAPSVASPETVVVRAETLDHLAPLATASANISVTPPEGLIISTQELPVATSGMSYSAALSGSGGTAPYSWSISLGVLPSGMQLDRSSGVISGTTSQAGPFSFTASLKDAASNQTAQSLALTVSGAMSNTGCVPGPPNYLCSTNSTANPGRIAPIFKSTAPTSTTCSGMCQNSTAYDTTLNPAGIDCITRITDGTTFPSGQSMGNLTFSGGDNDIMGSVNETYLGVNTGQVYILHLNTSGKCIQVVNTGTPGIHVAGPFGFSKVVDTRFYYLVNQTQVWQGDITSDSTYMPTKLVDIFAKGVCPGITPFDATSASIMGISQNDDRFGWSVGPSTQGSADWAFVWDRNQGCASVNLATGKYWDFCSSSCGPTTPPSGTLASSGCYGSQGSTMHGIHDSQMSGDGNWMIFAMQVTGTSKAGWTQGVCAGSTLSNQQVIWQIGTSGSQWAYSNPSLGVGGAQSGSHNSAGATHYVTPYYNGPNIRNFSNVAPSMQFAAPVIATDEHLSWPNPLGDDSYPWVGASDLVTTANGGVYAPTYMQNVVYAWFPNAASPIDQLPRLFSHTFSCGANSYATCTRGGDPAFGAQQSIGVATQKGNYFCWTSTHLQSLGKDNLGNPRSDGFCVHLQ
jgi:hypothetical protein